MRSIVAALSVFCLASSVVACAAEPAEEDVGATQDPLSEQECNKIVSAAQAKSKRECTAKDTQADAKESARLGLERNVVSALNAFVTEAKKSGAANRSAIDEAIGECSAIGCSGELSGADVKAECGVEKAFLQAACYVRNLPDIKRAVGSIDFADEAANLESALGKMKDQWVSLATQEVSLRAQHKACSTYAGSAAQKLALEKTCRASCNEDDATNLGTLQTGHNSACSPPGYEQVKDDLGQLVECGAMKRPLRSLGTVCECAEQKTCMQFAAVAGSSERGKRCTTKAGKAGFNKVVWSNATKSASIECR